ncbi:sugar kinase [Sphingomonas sp.]
MELVTMARGIVAIGEGMIELSRADAGDGWRSSHGGDTLNTAIYLARLGERVAYLSALGDDARSNELRRAWADEGLDVASVLTVPGRLPGLYMIETDDRGERRFLYWREQAAVRSLFEAEGIDRALASAGEASLVYLTGITLALFDEAGRARLAALCNAVRARGGEIAFDPNYRPRLWPDPRAARDAIADFARLTSIALPTFDDEQLLYGAHRSEDCARRWREWGVREVVVKQGERGATLFEDEDGGRNVPTRADARPVDTTGAGDAFNAGYLAARRRGLDAGAAAIKGNRLAGVVVRHCGAIVARDTMEAAA